MFASLSFGLSFLVMWVQATRDWLKSTVDLLIKRHEDLLPMLKCVVPVEGSDASCCRVGGSIFLLDDRLSYMRELFGHEDLLVVTCSITSNHESCW